MSRGCGGGLSVALLERGHSTGAQHLLLGAIQGPECYCLPLSLPCYCPPRAQHLLGAIQGPECWLQCRASGHEVQHHTGGAGRGGDVEGGGAEAHHQLIEAGGCA